MLRINTFNGFLLLNSDGSPARELPRRLAAIIVKIAHAGDQGASRERILELLWGDNDPARARHALTQSLYTLRRALGDDAAILGTSQLTLHPELVSSDIADFVAAERRGDDETAVSLYRGPFLDGFFVSGAAEFEQWQSLRREEYANRAAQMIERLAAAAESAGDITRASNLWRQRSAIDPYDATVVLQLMRLLAESGNVAGAIQQGRIYERLVEQELELPVDARIAAMLRDLAERPIPARRSPAVAHPALVLEPGMAEPELTPTETPGQAASIDTEGVGSAPALSPPSIEDKEEPVPVAASATLSDSQLARRRRARSWGAVAAGMAVVAMGAAGFQWVHRRPEPATPTREVAVLPFRITGADPSVANLGEGMVDLLAHAIDDGSDPGAVVDPGESLRAWRNGGGNGTSALTTDSLLQLARSLGARRAIVGALVGNAQNLVINATLHDVTDGAILGRATASGPLDSLEHIAPQVAVQLVAQGAGEGDIVAAQPSIQVGTLRAFIRGRQAQRRGDWRAALTAYATAVRKDSTFASAALGMAIAADWLEDRPSRSRGLTLVAAHRRALSPRERAQLDALAGARYPQPALAAEQLAAWERAVALAPDREDVWTELARRLLHEGAAAGVPRPLERARRAIERALAINPGYFPARQAKIALLVATGDTAGLARWRAGGAETRAHAHRDALEDWRIAAGLGDEATLIRLRPTLDTLGKDVLRRIALYGIHDAEQVLDGLRAARVLTTRLVAGDERVDALLAEHAYALAGGRPQEAQRIVAALAAEPSSNGAHLRLQLLDALYADGDSVAARSAALELAARLARPIPDAPDERSIYLADLCAMEQWKVWRGDLAGVTRAIRLLGNAGETRYVAPITSSATACAVLLETIVAARQRSPRASEELAYFESLSFAGPTLGDVRQYASLAIARLREERGEHTLALATVRRRSYGRDWPRYLGAALLLESELAARVGDRDGERRALHRFLALRTQAEPVAARVVDEARQRLQAVEQ